MRSILLVLTGGTICSFEGADGKRSSDARRAQAEIVANFRNSGSLFRSEQCVRFEMIMPLDILSENMTIAHWNTLISALREAGMSSYDGVIILHGTDTLAYTSSLLSVLLSGTDVPVMLVSSLLPLSKSNTNGNANFRAAVELIVNGIAPNVYAVYRNSEPTASGMADVMYLHYGSRLCQCASYSGNFYSAGMTALDPQNARLDGGVTGIDRNLINRCAELSPCVLRIQPYVGIDYDRYSLKGVKAVVHSTYHSSTLVTESCDSSSAVSLCRRCSERGIPFFLEPCPVDTFDYSSTSVIIDEGAVPIWGMTTETAYAKVLVGCCCGLRGDELVRFVRAPINNEFIC